MVVLVVQSFARGECYEQFAVTNGVQGDSYSYLLWVAIEGETTNNNQPTDTVQIHIDNISAKDICCEMQRAGYQYAELLGTYNHPEHTSPGWTVRLYDACDTWVIDTNGMAVWYGSEDFDALCDEYGIKVSALVLPIK